MVQGESEEVLQISRGDLQSPIKEAVDNALQKSQGKRLRLNNNDQDRDSQGRHSQLAQLKKVLKHIGDLIGFKKKAPDEEFLDQ